MIYVFLGSEISVLKKKIDETISSLKINNIINYDFSDSSIIDIINEVNYVDLFNEKKLIIVNNNSSVKKKTRSEPRFGSSDERRHYHHFKEIQKWLFTN